MFRSLRAVYVTMGFCLCRVCPRLVKSGRGSGGSLYVCRNDGNQSCYLREVWRQAGSDKIYVGVRRSLPNLLHCSLFVKRTSGWFGRLHSVRFLGWHYVAGDYQHLFRAAACRGNGNVCSAGYGWRSWRRIWAELNRQYYAERGEQSAKGNVGWLYISIGVDPIAFYT